MNCYHCDRVIREGAEGLHDHAPGCPVPELIAIAAAPHAGYAAAAQLTVRLQRHSALLAMWCGVPVEELIADAGVLMQLVSVRLQQRAGG